MLSPPKKPSKYKAFGDLLMSFSAVDVSFCAVDVSFCAVDVSFCAVDVSFCAVVNMLILAVQRRSKM